MTIIFVVMLTNTFTVYAEAGDHSSSSGQSISTSTDSENSKAKGGFSPPIEPLKGEEAAQQGEAEEDEEEEDTLMIREVC